MEIIKHKIKQLDSGTFALVVYLDARDSEFTKELDSEPSAQHPFLSLCKKIVKSAYPSLKVTTVHVVVGGLLLTTLPLATTSVSAKTDQHSVTNSIYYHVKPGDSLWTISNAFNVTTEGIKQANQLTSDVIEPNQQLIIPKAFHTVSEGDSLFILARNYRTTITAIQEANQLKSESIDIGQVVIIPLPIDNPFNPSAIQPSTYTVKTGDNLKTIAKQYGLTVDALRHKNVLTTDFVRVGQTLVIPERTFKIQPIDEFYTVVSGDSLATIASRFDVSIHAIRFANSLSSDLLQIGQRLVIPMSKPTLKAPSPVRHYKTHTVAFGESLWNIASQYDVTVGSLKSTNNLKSDQLDIGQKLVIPKSE